MNTNLLDIKFARIGARLKITDRPARHTSGVITLDARTDGKGEFFEIVHQPGAEAEWSAPQKLVQVLRESLTPLEGQETVLLQSKRELAFERVSGNTLAEEHL